MIPEGGAALTAVLSGSPLVAMVLPMIYLLAHPTVLSVPAQVPALEAVDPVLAVEAPAIAPSLRSSISNSSIETSSSFILFMPFACHARSAIYLIAVGVIHLTATLLGGN